MNEYAHKKGGMMEDDDGPAVSYHESDGSNRSSNVISGSNSTLSLSQSQPPLTSSLSSVCIGMDPVRSFVRRRLESSLSKHNLMIMSDH